MLVFGDTFTYVKSLFEVAIGGRLAFALILLIALEMKV